MAVEWSARSLRDLDRIWDFLAQRDEQLALSIDNALADRAEKLGRIPYIGRPNGVGMREYSMPDIQYVFAYRISGDGITILRVRSTREQA